MSENEIGLREARTQLGELVNRAEYAGQITYLMRHGRRVAAIVPMHLVPQESAMYIGPYTGTTVDRDTAIVVALFEEVTQWLITNGGSVADAINTFRQLKQSNPDLLAVDIVHERTHEDETITSDTITDAHFDRTLALGEAQVSPTEHANDWVLSIDFSSLPLNRNADSR